MHGDEALVVYVEPVEGEEGCGDGSLSRDLLSNAILNLATGWITRLPGSSVTPVAGSRLTEAGAAYTTFTRSGSLLVQRVLTAYRDAQHVGSQVLELRTRAGTRLATRPIATSELGRFPMMSAQMA